MKEHYFIVKWSRKEGWELDKPLYGVNHLASHVAVDLLTHEKEFRPSIALLVSGGHSSILKVNELTSDIESLGQTVDDAAGEAFDKIARLMNLGFPGGPIIDREARDGDREAIKFPRGLSQPKDMQAQPFDFSFSGLKTAVSRYLVATRLQTSRCRCFFSRSSCRCAFDEINKGLR